jgi:hypothetical protein
MIVLGKGNMKAREYILKVNAICEEREKSNKCDMECPLKNYGCGIPKNPDEIDVVIKLIDDQF